MLDDQSKIYIKDFDLWNVRKKVIDGRTNSPIPKERDIWWCSLGCNVGSEDDGKHDNFERPVIIFRMYSKNLFWIIPLTTQKRSKESLIHYTFTCKGITRAAEFHQMRTISGKRLDRYIETVSFEDFQVMRRYISNLI